MQKRRTNHECGKCRCRPAFHRIDRHSYVAIVDAKGKVTGVRETNNPPHQFVYTGGED